jgi:hypothetical protein
MIEPEKLESWMEYVRDEDLGVEDYDFLEEAVTQGNTLGNVGSYLAVYEEDGETYVDDELLEALDEKKTELAKEDSSAPGRIMERTNHREAVYGDIDGEKRSKIRSGEKTIQEFREEESLDGAIDGGFNGAGSGHEFIQQMIDDFREAATGYEETSEGEQYEKDDTPDTNSSSKSERPLVTDGFDAAGKREDNGGDNTMSDYEDSVDTYELSMDDHRNTFELLETAVGDVASGAVTVETAADELANAVANISGDYADFAQLAADYLRQNQSEMDDLALQASGTAEVVDDAVKDILDQVDADTVSDLNDVLSQSDEHEDRMDRMKDKVYGGGEDAYFD